MNRWRALVVPLDHVILALLATSGAACAGASEAPAPTAPPLIAGSIPSASASAEPPASACARDDDCGYDPSSDRCGSEPRFNRQPPIVDQGILCFCDDRARVCQKHRVWPTPCESDASCAVSLEPRPHPVAATPAHPHERGKPCVDHLFSTTCERTNICTMHRHACGDGGAR